MLPNLEGVVFVFSLGSPQRELFYWRNYMKKITKFYLNKASYIAIDAQGNNIDLDVDYWESKFEVSQKNQELEKYAVRLLKKKHRVNFVSKIHED